MKNVQEPTQVIQQEQGRPRHAVRRKVCKTSQRGHGSVSDETVLRQLLPKTSEGNDNNQKGIASRQLLLI
jgi:hypothetical protein